MQTPHQQRKQTQYNFNLSSLIDSFQQQRIVSLPLQFQYLPVDILSKQFTKLNSHHPYRIHYLGPRFQNSYNLHQKFSVKGAYNKKGGHSPSLDALQQIQRYQINMRRIVQSNFITEKMKNNQHYKSAIYYRAFQGMNPTLDKSKQYVFNSAFQSGNLDCVIKIKEREFDLFLRIDSNTRGHLQWYYFSVKNSDKLGKLTLHICNISKSGTLYEAGLKPYIYSRKMFLKTGKQWQQGGFCSIKEAALRYKIIYEKTNPIGLNELTIQYDFQEQEDEVFFAYCIPYTYSRMLRDIKDLPSQLVKMNSLGRSLTGADIPILHITNHQNRVKKRNVLITGRVHPGQSNGSYLLKGFMDFLCSPQAQDLRNRVNFLIVPMINPDGVIMGNTRTSAAGKDLNREYRSSNHEMFPQISLIKSIAFKIKKRHGLDFYLDFHGHSRKKNTFFYGPAFIISQAQYYKCRILPRMIEKISNLFRFYSCSFMLGQQKKTTARGVFFQQFKIPYTYTIQSSIGFYYDSQLKATFPFNKQAWIVMGNNIAQGFSTFIASLEQFEQIIKQRRIQRQKQRQKKQKDLQEKRKNKKFLEDQVIEKGNTTNLNSIFMDMINQIKSMKTPNAEAELSSDDHDQKQDLQYSKYAEFNTLVNGKKDPIFSKGKLQGLQQIQKSSKRRKSEERGEQQLNIINQIAEQNIRNEKDRLKNSVSKIDSNKRIAYSNRAKKQFIIQKKVHPHFARRIPEYQTQQSQIQKRAENIKKIISRKLIPNQSKCLVLARQFFPESKCQILDFPQKRSVQSSRKDRSTSAFQAGIITPRLETRAQSRSSVFNKKRGLSDDKFQRKIQQGNGKYETQKEKIIVSSRDANLQRFSMGNVQIGSNSAKGNRRKYPFYQSSLFTVKHSSLRRKQQILENNDVNFQIMEIDNMAMTIRTFGK